MDVQVREHISLLTVLCREKVTNRVQKIGLVEEPEVVLDDAKDYQEKVHAIGMLTAKVRSCRNSLSNSGLVKRYVEPSAPASIIALATFSYWDYGVHTRQLNQVGVKVHSRRYLAQHNLQVGLTGGHKSGKEHAQDAGRIVGLIINDAKDELGIREEAKARSFDSGISIVQDLRRMGLNPIVFEICFPPTFPLSPLFFRILTPHFLPFIQGGGGHITGGGSICMDLLMSDGKPSQTCLSGGSQAIAFPRSLCKSSLPPQTLDPRPARLAYHCGSVPSNFAFGADYVRAYAPAEALERYKRATATHGFKAWRVLARLDQLVR
ncbi:hypothetical protein BD779DRAFT_1676017 [Infundibulicybe gibba]|nr:hypothetical protein BD779DRAFT_1676017 [Infundibulicybe gibba]